MRAILQLRPTAHWLTPDTSCLPNAAVSSVMTTLHSETEVEGLANRPFNLTVKRLCVRTA